MSFDPERLAYWFLRLNGFLTIENFIVHDERGGPQRTDADLMAFRFPHRREAFHERHGRDIWMKDDARFVEKQWPFAAFVEVATGQCKLNGPWTDSEKGNIPRALNALGALVTPKAVQPKALYETGSYRSDTIEIGLISIGAKTNGKVNRAKPSVMQITWNEVKEFIFNRFSAWERVKRAHPQWDPDGDALWHLFQANRRDLECFVSAIVIEARPPKTILEEAKRTITNLAPRQHQVSCVVREV